MAEQPTSTKYRDDIDGNGKDFLNPVIAVIIFFIISPLTVLGAVITYFAFAWQKIKISVMFWFGLVPYLIVVSFFSKFVVNQFIKSWTETIPNMFNKHIGIMAGLLNILAEQALLAIPLGILIGLIYSAYRWRTRPGWIESTFRMTPIEWFKKQKNIRDIKSDRNTPYDGMTLGINDKGKKVVQTYSESKAHTIIMGASGSGKTRTIVNRLRDSIKAGHGAVIIDLKGSLDLPNDAAELAKRYGKHFVHWTFQGKGLTYAGPAEDGPAYYDPIARGDATRRKDLIIESRTWTEPFYKIESSSYLQLLFSVLVENPKPGVSTLSDVVQLLNPHALQERAIPLGTQPEYQDVVRAIDALNDEKLPATKKSAIDSLASQLGVLLHSVAGPYLQLDPTGKNNININDVAHNGNIVVFSLDSSTYGELASLVANLVIQDLKTVSAELRKNPANMPLQIIIDEFQAVNSTNVIGLINRSRDAEMPVTLATQTLGDLKSADEKGGTVFLDQLIGVVNSFLIHRANKMDDALVFAGLTGTTVRKKFNEGVNYETGFIHRGSASGQGTIQDVEEFLVMPDKILHLKTGEMFYVNKSSMIAEKVSGILEDETLVQKELAKHGNKKLSFSTKASQVVATQTQHIIPESLIKSHVNEFVSLPSNKSEEIIVPTSDNSSLLTSTERSNSLQKSEKDTETFTSRPANHERLRKILNQDPDKLVPKNTRSDDFKVSSMPPRVSPSLPVFSPKSNFNKKLPPLPSLPPRPTLPKTDTAAPNDETLNKKTETKDEFDF